jgi:hypothetical protein
MSKSKVNNSESRNKFMEIVVSIENTNKDDKMLSSLLDKNRKNLNRRMRDSKFDELNINKDKLLYNNILALKRHTTLKNIKKFQISLLNRKKSQIIGNPNSHEKHLIKTFNNKNHYNILEEIKDNENENLNSNKKLKNNSFIDNISKENDFGSIILFKKNKNEERKNLGDDLYLDDKRLRKLDDLKNFFKLIDTHHKMQFEEDIDPTKPKLNFLRSKNNLSLFKTSITYDKNGVYYNKKYNLIFDKIYKDLKNKNFYKNNLYTIDYSSKLTNKKNKNLFIKEKKLNRIKSAKNSLLMNKKGIRNNLYSPTDNKSKKSKHSTKNMIIYKNNYLDNNTNIKNYVNLSRPQTSITTASNKTRFKMSSHNETTDVCETSSLSLISDNNLKTFNNSKKESNFSKFHNFTTSPDIKFRNNSKKIIYEMISDTLKKSNKMKNILKLRHNSKEAEEQKEYERKIKLLIKKKRTDLDKLVKELNLHYDEQNIDLEELVIKNVYNIKKHLQNTQQFRLMNKVANKVIVEDKILSKKVFLESSVAKKLRKRIKTKSDKEFDKLIEKRKYLKSKVMKYRKKTENEEMKALLKDNFFDFDNIKSLKEMIYKYRTMNHYK